MNVSQATAESNRAQLENLNVQRGFCNIRAPISGRISTANVKVGNFVRQADAAPMATIIQMSPIYVSFTVSQKNLPDIRQAIAAKTATIEAAIPGETRRAAGAVTLIENTVDVATGMATVRATMPNKDELLWPGTLVNTEMTLRKEEAVRRAGERRADQPDRQFCIRGQGWRGQGAADHGRTPGRQCSRDQQSGLMAARRS